MADASRSSLLQDRGHVRRATLLLAVAQVCLWAAIGIFASFGPLTIARVSELAGGAPLLFGLYYLAAAPGAVIAGRAMDRWGRRRGLAVGYVTIAAAGVGAWVAAALGSTGGLLATGAAMGFGSSAALLGRGAVAEMYPPDRRGRAVGLLVMTGAVGAVGGPPLASGAHALAGALGVADPAAVPWLLVPMLAVVATVCVLAIRRDPRDLAHDGPAALSGRPWSLLRDRVVLVAVSSIAVTQVVMVTFMGVVPVLVSRHGTGELGVSLVVSLHLGAMFALSPLIGTALDRWGRLPGSLAGLLATALGVAAVGLVGGSVPAGGGLFLVGVGWSAAYLASTALVSDRAAPGERSGALGAMDLVASLAAGAGALGSAVLLERAGVGTVSVVAALLLAVPLLWVLRTLPRAAAPMEIPERAGGPGPPGGPPV